MRGKRWYADKEKWEKTVDIYLNILHSAKSYEEVAKELGVFPKTAWLVLKRMEKEGYLYAYILNEHGKIGYIRRLPWREL